MSTRTIEVSASGVEAGATKSDPIKLSATRLKAYLTCPRQFRYRYIDEEPTILTGALAFGKTIHQVIHDLHQWSIYSGEPLHYEVAVSNFARLWEKVIEEEEPVLKDVAEIADYARLAELILLGYVEANKDKPQPFLLEFPFEIEMRDEHYGHNYVLCGVIDRIDQEEDGLIVVDFKTGKRKPSPRDLASDIQLSVYAFAAAEVFGQSVKQVILYHLRDQTELSAQRNSGQLHQLKDFLMPHVIQGIADRKFAPRPGYWCNFCQFKDRCLLEGPEQTE